MWKVMRQDDVGNVFLVADRLTKEDAEFIKATLESHKHRQLYWIEKE